MRISDWSSDVCSSDLAQQRRDLRVLHLALQPLAVEADRIGHRQNLHLAEAAAAFHEGEVEGFVLALAIGRASCRERVCQYVEIAVVAVSVKKKQQPTKYVLKHTM